MYDHQPVRKICQLHVTGSAWMKWEWFGHINQLYGTNSCLKGDTHSDGQKNSLLHRNWKVHHCFHKIPPKYLYLPLWNRWIQSTYCFSLSLSRDPEPVSPCKSKPSSAAVESSCNVMAHGDAREGKWRGKWANGVGSRYSSHYLGTWCIQHYYRWCAHLGCQ